MRDLFVLCFTIGGAFVGLVRPWMGVLALTVLAYLNPHRYAWGYSRTLPVYFIVFMATLIGLFFSKDRQAFPWTRETRLFLYLLIWFSITTFISPDFPYAAQDQWVKVMKVYVGIFPTFWLITSRERLRWLVVVMACSFGLIGLKGGIFALGTAFHYRVWGPSNTFYGGNNEIAMALNMTLPLILLVAKECQSRLARYFFYAMFFFSVCSVISTWSRGGLMTLTAVLGCLILTSQRKWLAVPLLLIGLAFFIPRMPERWLGRMETIQSYDQDTSVLNRFDAWQYAIDRARHSPLTGGGFETFLDAQVDAHSAYFEILGEHGYVALLLWLSLLFGTMLALQRLRKRAQLVEGFDWLPDYARAVQIALLAYATGGAFLGTAYWDYFYHLIALCVIMKVLLAEAENKATEAVVQNGRSPAVVEIIKAPA